MGASFWVYVRGQWRRLEVSSGRVSGWAGRARFCFVRRGRVHQARAAAVLRGLRALQADQPTSVRDGLPLSQRRRVRAARAASPRCCCRRADADARNALVQLNLTALQTSTAPQKTDAAVQADGQTQDGEQPGRPPGPAPRSDSEQSAPACKELIVNEEDVAALRRFLARSGSGAGLLAADLRRFDADDDYKSALFYRINPLVCAERDARIPAMLARERDERRLLRAFAGELGLRAVGDTTRTTTQADKDNHAADHKSPNKSHNKSRITSHNKSRNTLHCKSRNTSHNKSRNTSRNSRKSVDSDSDASSSGDSDAGSFDSDFQTRSIVTNKKPYERNTRSKFSEIRSKYEKSKSERDDDVRSKYLVTPRHAHVASDGSTNDDRPKRSRRNNSDDNWSKDREILSKDKERNKAHIHNKRKETQRNRSKNRNDISKENGPSTSNLRSRDESVSPSIITGRSKTRKAKASSGNSDSTDLQVRNSIIRDRRGRFRNARARTDRLKKYEDSNNNDNSKDRKRNDWSPSKSDTAKDKKRNDTRLNHIHSKDRHTESESSQNHSSKSKIALKDKSKTVNGISPKTTMKRKLNALEDDDASDNVWASRNGTEGVRDGGAQSKGHRTGEESNDEEGKDGVERRGSKRPRRSTANAGSVYPEKRREYSSLEDHAIVQWVSLGARATRVNGNAVWRELQEQFGRIAGRSRSWHSLRNRYLRSILPALGALALPPARVTALRAAQAQGEIKSRRRAPVPNPLLALPPVRSAWGARPRGGRPDDTQDTLVPATSESEPPSRATQRTLRSSTTRADSPRRRSPRTAPPPSPKRTNASSRKDQPSPTYSDVTRRFGARQAASTPELRPRDTAPQDTAPRDTSPHKRTRKLFNPKTAM